MTTNWFEVWADEGHEVPYILILRPSERGFEILEPAQGNKRVVEHQTYDVARMWLLEDEFVLVGRKELDGF